MREPSARAQVITRRTYNRPLDMDNPVEFETWEQTVERVLRHQWWLWDRADNAADDVTIVQARIDELTELKELMLDRAGSMSGRSLWLAGTPTSQEVECCLFNCAFTCVETVHDVVDAFWLLLNGCGVGFEPVTGSLFGFSSRPTVRVVPSNRESTYRGSPDNVENYEDGVWTIRVGDSARAWAKSVGKLIAGKHVDCHEIILDFSKIRGPGGRLRGYGWICAGYKPLADALVRICSILSEASGRMLNRGEIHDLINHLGTVLSTRRSAQIALCPITDPDLDGFIKFKHDIEELEAWHRCQSNNSVNGSEHRDYDRDIRQILGEMFGGCKGEPGLRNQSEARRRACWSRGTNPCAEILLPNKGFCNLVEVNLAHPRFLGPHGFTELCRTINIVARANYRQTCVNLRDGILQRAWDENNRNIRLCGVGLTGIVQRLDLSDGQIKILRTLAREGADSMARELRLPRSQAVTTVKPSGTLSKIMDCTDGVHEPLGHFIFNRVTFGPHDPLLPVLREAGYQIEEHPTEHSYLVVLPAEFPDAATGSSAIEQLNRYLRWNTLWADHNVSCTVYYNEDEKEDIIQWFQDNWTKGVVGVSLLPREHAEYAYLPQESVDEATFREYTSQLKPVSFGVRGIMEDELAPDCAGGACPIR